MYQVSVTPLPLCLSSWVPNTVSRRPPPHPWPSTRFTIPFTWRECSPYCTTAAFVPPTRNWSDDDNNADRMHSGDESIFASAHSLLFTSKPFGCKGFIFVCRHFCKVKHDSYCIISFPNLYSWKSAIVYGYVFVSSPPHLFMVRSSRCSKSPRASTTVRFTSSHRRKYARTPLFEIVGVTLLH